MMLMWWQCWPQCNNDLTMMWPQCWWWCNHIASDSVTVTLVRLWQWHNTGDSHGDHNASEVVTTILVTSRMLLRTWPQHCQSHPIDLIDWREGCNTPEHWLGFIDHHQRLTTIAGIGRSLSKGRTSIRYIVTYTRSISKDHGNTAKLLPRV